MNLNRNHFIGPPQREALISITALYFIEEHALLNREQLDDAKKSLQALFLRTSGEETMLRKLIDILKTSHNIHQTFASIAGILGGVSRCVVTLQDKVTSLRQTIANRPITPDENAAFVGPFLAFSAEFLTRILAYSRSLQTYIELKEQEARCVALYRIAREARERLKQRLAGGLGSQATGAVEARIKDELVSSFDYGETQSKVKAAMRESHIQEREIQAQLNDIKAMCQMAMNPTMREQAKIAAGGPAYEDVFTYFSEALKKYRSLALIKDAVVELFKLYQHCFGMFSLDFNKLNQAIGTMIDNTDAYFSAKEEDRDIAVKRDKLKKIEGLIPFLEYTAKASTDKDADTYYRFSRELSTIISSKKSQWAHIGEDLLRAKVQAEAELSTRL